MGVLIKKNIFRCSSPPAGGGRAVNFMYTVYAIYNKENSKIYIGQTKDLIKRLDIHNLHKFKGYTSRFSGLWILIYSEQLNSISEALVREKQLKSYRGREFIKKHIPV